jgi:hypothetical protein
MVYLNSDTPYSEYTASMNDSEGASYGTCRQAATTRQESASLYAGALALVEYPQDTGRQRAVRRVNQHQRSDTVGRVSWGHAIDVPCMTFLGSYVAKIRRTIKAR